MDLQSRYANRNNHELNLFTPVVPNKQFHANFAALLDDGMADVREVLGDWASTFPDKDGNFVIEFQTKFNQQFWELYMHASFTHLGFTPKSPWSRPDYQLMLAGKEVLAEATTTQHVNGLSPEWVRDLDDFIQGNTQQVFQYGTIRFSNSLTSKLQKYREGYVKLEHVPGKPFLLAIGHYEQPLFYLNGHVPALRVLFGLDEPLQISGPEIPLIVGESARPTEGKRGDLEIELGFFRDDRASEISAVLVSSLATVAKCHALSNRPANNRIFWSIRYSWDGQLIPEISVGSDYREGLLDGLHLFINGFAKTPINWNPFYEAGITVHTFSEEAGYVQHTKESNLSVRFCRTVRGVSDERLAELRELAARRKEEARIQRPSIPIWSEDVLVPVPGRSFIFGQPLHDQQHLAHHKGWTIHLCRDITDNDWFGQAVPGIHNNVQGVIFQNEHDEREGFINPIRMVANEPTKESAWRNVADQIDQRIGGAT